MKKVTKILFIFSVLMVILMIGSNLVISLKILTVGMTVGSSNQPDSVWFWETKLQGISGVKDYYRVNGDMVLLIDVPIVIICGVYIIIYLLMKRKDAKKEKENA